MKIGEITLIAALSAIAGSTVIGDNCTFGVQFGIADILILPIKHHLVHKPDWEKRLKKKEKNYLEVRLLNS